MVLEVVASRMVGEGDCSSDETRDVKLKIDLFLDRTLNRTDVHVLACGWLEPHLCGSRDVTRDCEDDWQRGLMRWRDEWDMVGVCV